MRHFFTAFILLISSTVAVYGQEAAVIKDDNARPRTVSEFHSIEISSGVDLYLSQGKETALAVSAKNDSEREKVKTVVENGVLKISYGNRGFMFQINRNAAPLRVYLSVTDLKSLSAYGGSDVVLKGNFTMNTLSIKVSGGSDCVGGNIVARQLNLDIEGGSDLRLSGTVENLKVEASGGSDLLAYGLTAKYAILHCSGGSDIQVTVEKEMYAEASGGSDVHYKGNPQVKDSRSSGGSDIIHKS